MALKAYPKLIFKPAVEVVSSIDEKPTRIDCNEAKRAIYVEGAKAVLDEIEKFLTWKDIKAIDHLLFDVKTEYDNGTLDDTGYYKEVLKEKKRLHDIQNIPVDEERLKMDRRNTV